MYILRARCLLTAIALLATFSASAGIYKWVDDEGRVHYGDRPASDAPTLQIEVDEAPSTAPASDALSREEKRRRLLETMQEEREEKAERRADIKAERERDHARCIQYKDRMRRFERASRLYSLDRDGNRVYMSSEQRDKSTRELQAKIRKYCH